MERCFAVGTVAHIAKPIDREALVLLILREVMRARSKPA
jgi:CheY-like chemotaxis protein